MAEIQSPTNSLVDCIGVQRKSNDEYTLEDLKHLSDREQVRNRPALFIGDTSTDGLHDMACEVVANSICEVVAGFATQVHLVIHADSSVTVEDDGRGIPVDRHAELSKELGQEVPTLEGMMTVLKLNIRLAIANFLSEWCIVECRREGQIFRQEYQRGKAVSEVRRVATTEQRGTKITFKPDAQIFQATICNSATLARNLQELASLNVGVRINLKDERCGRNESFMSQAPRSSSNP